MMNPTEKISLGQDEVHAGRGTERGPTYKRNMSFMETMDSADAAKRAKAAQEPTEMTFMKAVAGVARQFESHSLRVPV